MTPLKVVVKLVGNSIVGCLVLSLINIMGIYVNFYININILSTLITGLLGLPGIILLVAIKAIFRI